MGEAERGGVVVTGASSGIGLGTVRVRYASNSAPEAGTRGRSHLPA